MLPSQRQLKYDNAGPVLLICLKRESGRVPIEHLHPYLIPDWCVCEKDVIPGRFPCIHTVGHLCLLQDAQIHVILGHLVQGILQISITAISYVVRPESKNFLLFAPLPCHSYPPHSQPHTLTHTRLTDLVSSCPPLSWPACPPSCSPPVIVPQSHHPQFLTPPVCGPVFSS